MVFSIPIALQCCYHTTERLTQDRCQACCKHSIDLHRITQALLTTTSFNSPISMIPPPCLQLQQVVEVNESTHQEIDVKRWGRETRWTTSQPPQGAGYAPIQSISLSRLPRSHLPHAQAAGVNKETDRQDSQTYRALTHSQPPQHVLQHTAPTVHTYAGRTIRTIAPHTYPCPGRSRCQKRKSRTSVLILEALCYRGIGIIKRDL